MRKSLASCLAVLLTAILLAACGNVEEKPSDFDLAIEKLAARTVCHTSEEFITILSDEEVVQSIDRMYADGDVLYTMVQNGLEVSAIVERDGRCYERLYDTGEWESSNGSTSLPPYHVRFLPEHYIVESIEETADGITVKCQADTSKADVEFVEATAEFLFDADWNALEYGFFNSYMIENHDGEEILLSYKNHVTFLTTEEKDIRQTIEDTFAEAKASAE